MNPDETAIDVTIWYGGKPIYAHSGDQYSRETANALGDLVTEFLYDDRVKNGWGTPLMLRIKVR